MSQKQKTEKKRTGERERLNDGHKQWPSYAWRTEARMVHAWCTQAVWAKKPSYAASNNFTVDNYEDDVSPQLEMSSTYPEYVSGSDSDLMIILCKMIN